MDSTNLNTNVIQAIKDRLPEKVAVVQFLSDILFLNKGAIYRRLRGEIPFSFHEIYLIAQKLEVSLDYLAKSKNKEVSSFELILQQFQSNEKNTSISPSKFEQILGNIMSDSSSTFELSHNLFPQVPSHLFYHLSKYSSFKWIYKNSTNQLTPFKKVDYPQEIFEMHKKNNMETMKIKQTSYIWDDTIIETLVREIKYFADIKLLDNEDVAVLKGELSEFLDYVEELAIKGTFPTGNKVKIYISSVNTDAAYSYMESPNFRICIIGVLDLQYMISTDNHSFEIIKGKIMSLKKGSTLISESNEMYRISYFQKQRELVDTL
ncbi:hypothetical protein LJC72_04345 [Bacteroides sp. OttesenSCG-928-D19]|nr:hypothetical protein [Bacteroides sp. OttesenSCG-928-D19]